MDQSKQTRTVTIHELRPVVRRVNYREVMPGEAWPERVMRDVELILIVSGAFEYQVHGAPLITLRPGDVLFKPGGVVHTFRRLGEPHRAAFSCIMGELIPNARWSAGDYRFSPEPHQVTQVGSASVIHDLFMRCCEVYEGYDRYRAELLETLAKETWIRLSEYWDDSPSVQIPEAVRPMVTYIRANLTKRIGRAELAKQFHISPTYVNVLFRRELGMTPGKFLNRERVFRGYRYIRDKGLSVKEAATLVGFDDPFYFSRVFTKIFNRPPSSVLHAPAQPQRGPRKRRATRRNERDGL